MPPRALWLNSRSASRPMAATLHASKGYPGAALEHQQSGSPPHPSFGHEMERVSPLVFM
jgi:hypothetical protein